MVLHDPVALDEQEHEQKVSELQPGHVFRDRSVLWKGQLGEDLHRYRRHERVALEPFAPPFRLDLDRAHGPVLPLQLDGRGAGQDAAAARLDAPREAIRKGSESAAWIVEERRVVLLRRLLEPQQAQQRVTGPGAGNTRPCEVHRDLTGISPHLPGERLEDQLVNASTEPLQDVLLVRAGFPAPEQPRTQGARVAQTQPHRANRSQERQQVAQPHRVVEEAIEEPDPVELLVLDQLIPEEPADLLQDPGNHRVQLVGAVVQGEAIALEAGA